MADTVGLSDIQKYIRTKAQSQVILRGKAIFNRNFLRLDKHDAKKQFAVFQVRSQSSDGAYDVIIKNYEDTRKVTTDCTCPFNDGICKHRVAALLYVEEHLLGQEEIMPELPDRGPANRKLYYEPVETDIQMDAINLDELYTLAGWDTIAKSKYLVDRSAVAILSAKNQEIKADVTDDEVRFHLTIYKKDRGVFTTSCNCVKNVAPLCAHRLAVFNVLLLRHGKYYFDTLLDDKVLMGQLLAEYGYTLKDKTDDKFDFYKDNRGIIRLKTLDPSLRKLSTYESKDALKDVLASNSIDHTLKWAVKEPQLKKDYAIGFYLDFALYRFPRFQVIPFYGKLNKENTSISSNIRRFDCYSPPQDVVISDNQHAIFRHLQSMINSQLLKYLCAVEDGKYAAKSEEEIFQQDDKFSDEEKTIMRRYLHERWWQLVPLLEQEQNVLFKDDAVADQEQTRLTGLAKVKTDPVDMSFKLTVDEQFLELEVTFYAGEQELSQDINLRSGLFFIQKDEVYLFRHYEDYFIAEYFGANRRVKVNRKDLPGFFKTYILPLQQKFEVSIPDNLVQNKKIKTYKEVVFLKELNDRTLLFTPAVEYNGYAVELSDATDLMMEEKGEIVRYKRDKEREAALVSFMKELHPSFHNQGRQGFFHISFDQALKNNWCLIAFQQLKERGLELYGFKELKKFRYNPNKASIRMQMTSGIDWFDVNIRISFGDQEVSLKDLKKAIISKQNYIQLGDGSLGLLPEEWIKKHYMLFRMGNEQQDKLQVSKMHFSIIDQLYDEVDDEKLRHELDEKRQRLHDFESLIHIEAPDNIKATLRPYQQMALGWFDFLQQFGWGGCLADDMGLGKTLQTLTHLQIIKNKQHNLSALIVCPNSLIFNWENEIRKFSPELTFYIHHGNQRTRSVADAAKEHDIIITTYGTLRSDIEEFYVHPFDYAILDESQAIKNPVSKIAKAVQLLRCKHRLVLTGTPLQNNTFDLYAQMNFLNPGLLGSMEVFKNEFATPIDKFRDNERTEQLKKLVYPFMLRRTKEQVAVDLPAKTETILYCEMGEQQRKVYNAFRQDFRGKIMKRIEEEGLAKSGIYILQGLMKLRQICDSPAILNEEEDYGDESVKLEELIREIEENVGDHKVLVFSQFLGMLDMIRKRLQKSGIDFEYLDGNSKNRRESVHRFQEDESCKVFLISLTAGGVGLNLTAADYVYLVDPWWNPAVEQQAIDRTHRIGQTKNIFAYRMICKDTIEEKILKLQEHKRSLAKDLISDENAFVKNLSKDDIEYLFS